MPSTDSNDEINDPAVRENIPKKDDNNQTSNEPESEEEKVEAKEDVVDQDKDGYYYYSVNEKAYRVFDPESQTFITQNEKPSEEQISHILNKIAALPEPASEQACPQS